MSSPQLKHEPDYDATHESAGQPSREPTSNTNYNKKSAKFHKIVFESSSVDSSRDLLDSNDDYSETSDEYGRSGRSHQNLTVNGRRHYQSQSPAPPRRWSGKLSTFWLSNKGVFLVMLSQLFGAMMNVATRLLETDGEGMDPLQILFARMGITVVLCCIYMWYTEVPHFPFGRREVRALLVARGLGGFFGVTGMYYSLLYLPVAEATVLTFLAPILACWACSVLIKEPFTRMEQIAGVVSLIGVVLIARPVSFFSSPTTTTNASNPSDGAAPTNTTVPSPHSLDAVTPIQRLTAVGIAMIGVLGAACAYTTIRWIGKRAHPLISVNYFATWCTLVSTASLLFVPSLSFKLPVSLTQWAYLVFLGVCGFIMQFLLTAGLAHEKSSRATNMVYTQMLFALAFDQIVWGTRPGAWSIVGSALILGAALYVAVKRDAGRRSEDEGNKEGEGRSGADEEAGLIEGTEDGEDGNEVVEREEQGRGPLRGVQEVQLRTLRV